MKQIARILEDFGTAPLPAGPAMNEEELETIRLEAFENGYKAGWDDAAKALREEQSHIASDLARNLQDLSFTYTEAHSAVLSAIRPLMGDIIDKVVPDLARETLGLRIKTELEQMAKRKASQRVEILVAPDNLATTEGLMEEDFGFPLSVVPDDTLSEGQVFLRFDDEETEIDLNAVTDGIRQAVDSFFTEQERKIQNG
ncbi:ABC transporter ATP-binding protein [Pseudooceanicola sediminis]|mgnify:CR=1 FL=1|uniref:ABC transporter ATP-binding protein n=1 Tax=Pseudooceanicola sediminis TaxID=2211117 RepID=A0A399J4F9_9RHOB|nr:ABC transporter ATP-binding protein [Pseudooceanicola sediminis]KAA2315585.1 ABC transporter ATP-binding protein [Puniceibacterium sp. HSS470]RII40214.1 ABC transporter ATP-binding protein [Pseudooceanicola sediminis]|tara:strand:- start:1053 stop:1649 length:597 start_codon:yes stop_codon:yes gene_type:complete